MAVKKYEKKNPRLSAVIAAAVVLIGSIAFMTTSCSSGTINSSEKSGEANSSNESTGDVDNTNENSGGETDNSKQYGDSTYSYENITRETIAEINKTQFFDKLSFWSCTFDEGVLAELAPQFNKDFEPFIDFQYCTGVDDLSFMSKYKNAKTLYFINCGLTDSVASALSEVEAEYVNLSGNPELTQLTLNTQDLLELDLSGTKVENLDFLASAQKLYNLNLQNTNVSDLSPIAPLTEIMYLNLSGSKVNSFATELGCRRLSELYLNGCGLTSSEGLEDYIVLSKLDLGNNSLTDVSFIADLTPYLELLDLSGNDITGSDLAFLEKSEDMIQLGLDSIDLSECQLSFCENMQDLESLLARNCNLTDISGIQNCTKLRYIVLGFNEISDVSPLPSFIGIYGVPQYKGILDLTNNQVESIAPLNNYYDMVLLTGNPVSNAEIGDGFSMDCCMIDYFDGIESSALIKEPFGLYISNCPEDKQEEIINIAPYTHFCTRAEQLEEIESRYRELRYNDYEEMYLEE